MRVNRLKSVLIAGFFLCMFMTGIACPCRVEAAHLYFPYYADTWPQIEGEDLAVVLSGRKSEDEETAPARKEDLAKEETDNTEEEETGTGNTEPEEIGTENIETDKNKLSAEDLNTLYKVVSMECDTGYEGSLAVISCMLNRQASGKYPDDLMDVVREKAQFTAYYDRETETYPYLDREPSKECIAAVNDALEQGKRNLPSYIYYFRSSDYEYLNGYITYGQIGDNTYFYQYEDQK